MGGCRCTYRTCSSRTDGKTHMFHYPVFDKIRCHQWITNARKLEFLNLKVSQLRNRVVCQHHFKDENFMNFKKDKLTFDAVPTEDGPYCDTSETDNTKGEQDDSKLFSISLDDIENEYLTIVDKKANFSVKYGDFLTNCELMDLNSLNTTNQINDNSQIDLNDNDKLVPVISKDLVLRKKPVKCVKPQIRQSSRGKQLKSSGKSILNNANVKENIINHDLFQDTSTIQRTTIELSKQNEIQLSDLGHTVNYSINVSEVPVEFSTTVCQEAKPDETQFNINDISQIHLSEEKPNEPSCTENQNGETKLDNHELIKNINQPVAIEVDQPVQHNISNEKANTNRSFLNETKKIKIISEKKIVNPKPIIGKLEPVSPNKILTFPNKRKNYNSKSNTELKEVPVVEKVNPVTDAKLNASTTRNVEKSNMESEVIHISEGMPAAEQIKTEITKNRKANEIAPKTSLLKNIIPPERVAAIAEKRKFNMKLRDIVEDCLDKLDEPKKTDYENRPTLQETRLLQSKKRQVASHLSEESQLPNIQEYTLAFLEARMKKMENNLLNKIEENSQRIMELKQAYAPSSSKRSVHTQTQVSEDVHKKHLYQQLSQYLSQEANSLLYEELFINKYTKDVPKCSSPKRRKRR